MVHFIEKEHFSHVNIVLCFWVNANIRLSIGEQTFEYRQTLKTRGLSRGLGHLRGTLGAPFLDVSPVEFTFQDTKKHVKSNGLGKN